MESKGARALCNKDIYRRNNFFFSNRDRVAFSCSQFFCGFRQQHNENLGTLFITSHVEKEWLEILTI